MIMWASSDAPPSERWHTLIRAGAARPHPFPKLNILTPYRNSYENWLSAVEAELAKRSR
jgi:hypothetical protein